MKKSFDYECGYAAFYQGLAFDEKACLEWMDGWCAAECEPIRRSKNSVMVSVPEWPYKQADVKPDYYKD